MAPIDRGSGTSMPSVGEEKRADCYVGIRCEAAEETACRFVLKHSLLKEEYENPECDRTKMQQMNIKGQVEVLRRKPLYPK